MTHWVIFESDKLRPNMDKMELKPLTAIKGEELKVLKFSSEEDAYRSLTTPNASAYNAKNQHKDCSYLILKVYE